jgi:hypothetical protein
MDGLAFGTMTVHAQRHVGALTAARRVEWVSGATCRQNLAWKPGLARASRLGGTRESRGSARSGELGECHDRTVTIPCPVCGSDAAVTWKADTEDTHYTCHYGHGGMGAYRWDISPPVSAVWAS